MKNYYFVLKTAPGPAYRVVYLKLPNRFRTTKVKQDCVVINVIPRPNKTFKLKDEYQDRALRACIEANSYRCQ